MSNNQVNEKIIVTPEVIGSEKPESYEVAQKKEPSEQFKDWALLTHFFTFVRPYWKWVFLGLSAIPFSVGSTLLQPWLIILIIDDNLVKGNLEGLNQTIPLLALAVVFGYLSDAIYTYALQKSGQMAISDMRSALYSHILSLPRTFFDLNPVGVVLTRLTSDMEALGESLAIGVLTIFTDFIKTIALFLFLFYLNWKLTLVILFMLPVIYVISNYLRTKLRHYYNLTRKALAGATGFLHECLSGVKTIQLYAAEKRVIKRFKNKNNEFLEAQNKSNFYDAALFSIIEGITSISLGLIIWFGAKLILASTITIGVLIGFLNILHRIFIPIREFTQQISAIQRALAALEHIHRLFLEKKEESNDNIEKSLLDQLKLFEELRFDNVYFRYSDHGPYILKGVSFSLKKGDRLAIVGSTGSGKSTVVRIITQNYTDYQGSVTINGVELCDIPRKHLQDLIAMMQQDVYLFNETLEFNISLNRPHIDLEAVKKAARFVYAHTFIERFPQGYDYQVLENGKNLSAGQSQLISFSRALAGKNELIILDEATGSIDSVTEDLIQKATEKVFQEKTVIAIAHRLSTIQHSDQILVLQEGQICERGTHQSLIELQGIYANLFKTLEEST